MEYATQRVIWINCLYASLIRIFDYRCAMCLTASVCYALVSISTSIHIGVLIELMYFSCCHRRHHRRRRCRRHCCHTCEKSATEIHNLWHGVCAIEVSGLVDRSSIKTDTITAHKLISKSSMPNTHTVGRRKKIKHQRNVNDTHRVGAVWILFHFFRPFSTTYLQLFVKMNIKNGFASKKSLRINYKSWNGTHKNRVSTENHVFAEIYSAFSNQITQIERRRTDPWRRLNIQTPPFQLQIEQKKIQWTVYFAEILRCVCPSHTFISRSDFFASRIRIRSVFRQSVIR